MAFNGQDQQAAIRISGNHGSSRIAALQQCLPRVDFQAAPLLCVTMALKACFGKDWPNLVLEVRLRALRLCRCRQTAEQRKDQQDFGGM
jgi:hypothetical protein